MYADERATTIEVTVTDSNDTWSVRFPSNSASPTSVTCAASDPGNCALVPAPPCTAFDSAAASPNYLSSFAASDCTTTKVSNRPCKQSNPP